MKSIAELRDNVLLTNKQPIVYRFRNFIKKDIDMNVFLPTIGKNLQRDLVWEQWQKQELIMSVFLRRHIPHLSIIANYQPGKEDDLYEIIDGKQRLTTLMDFYNNKFQVELEGDLYYYDQLPDEYKRQIEFFDLPCFIVYDDIYKPIQDSEKIEWFKLINFNATPQDREHLESLG